MRRKREEHKDDVACDNVYEVGYGKPPKQHRFKPGQSGNPRGRPKQADVTTAALIDANLAAPVKVVENGKVKWLTLEEVIIRTALNRAAAGKPGAMRELQCLLNIARYPEHLAQEAARHYHANPVHIDVNFVKSRFKKDENENNE